MPFLYQHDIALLIHSFKFHADMRAGRLLAILLLLKLQEHSSFLHHCALIPVPLHDARAKLRGFDQTDWLARRLARRHHVPIYHAKRIKDTPTQRGLKRKERLKNTSNAFVFDSALPPHVVLFDDVMTTGATFNALAHACRSAGAKHIGVLALARTPPGMY